MALRKRKPTSPGAAVPVGLRLQGDHLYRRLRSRCSSPSRKSGGRNSYGRKTSRHRGGGHKQQYRVIDFKRNKDGVPAKVATIEYDPNRNCRIALLHFADGEKRYILAAKNVDGRRHAPERSRRRDPSRQRAADALHPGRYRHSQRRAVSRRRRQDGSLGGFVACSSSPRKATSPRCAFRSSEMRRVPIDCRATVGEVGNSEFELIKVGKAGRSRWKGKRPQTRGVAMNPVDHPHGGGEGKTSGGRHPTSPWGKPEGRTRARRKDSDSMIIRRRRGRGARR